MKQTSTPTETSPRKSSETTAQKSKEILSLAIGRYRVRLILILVGIILIAGYRITSSFPALARSIYLGIIGPLSNRMATLYDHLGFAFIELLIAVLVIGCIVDFVIRLVNITKTPKTFIPDILINCIMLFCLIYGGFCILWGYFYAAPGAAERTGISAPEGGILHDDLIATDEFFLAQANEYADLVARDSEGHFVYSHDPYEYSAHLYDAISEEYPALSADVHRPKPIRFSRVMSYMDFTGFYSPFTGEACINADSPECMTPSTIAHELAHQRGIGAEDEANFIAVITCMADGDPDYVYSASLLALIHLQNALKRSGDEAQWERIRDACSDGVTADLADLSTYWSAFRGNAVNKAVTETYDSFLKSYDQTMGRETYGACVDLLVEYYRRMW